MSISLAVKDLEFDSVHHSHAIWAPANTDPRIIVDAFGLHPLPKGIIAISGGATRFPDGIVERTVDLIEEVIVPLLDLHNLLVVDGGTDEGVMKLLGEVLGRAKLRNPRIIGGENDDTPLLGFVPESKVSYPGKDPSSIATARLDPNHCYFVLVNDASDWGEEVISMFYFLDYLSSQGVSVVNIVANGGRVTIKEAYHAVQRGRPVIILEGSTRATEVIVDALNKASKKKLRDALVRLDIIAPNDKDKMEETIRWLDEIAKYKHIIRFDFLTRPLQDLKPILLSGLGITENKEPEDRRI